MGARFGPTRTTFGRVGPFLGARFGPTRTTFGRVGPFLASTLCQKTLH